MEGPLNMYHFNPLHHEGGDGDATTKRTVIAISIHSTTRVETTIKYHPCAKKKFQSTPPRGWRPARHNRTVVIGAFQSTPPRGWRPRFGLDGKTFSDFNPLHHEGGDKYPTTFTLRLKIFQSTPPRGWRLQYPYPLFPVYLISIHSTTRVETVAVPDCVLSSLISIHSTTRVETLSRYIVRFLLSISIHSTTRVETLAFWSS